MATSAVAEVLIRWRQEGQQKVQADARSMSKTLTEVGNKAKAAGTMLTLGLTAPLVLIGKQAVTAASDLNEATSAVTTVFGEASDEVIRFSRTAATNLGQSQQSALSAASAMGALFKGVGLSEDQMAKFSTSLLEASADLGSFFNVDPSIALDKLRSGLVGQAEPLREFGILLTEANVKARAIEMGLAGANGEISEGAKVQARYALIMDQVGAAQGDFARTSDGLANSSRTLHARMADLSAQIGEILLPYALKATQIISDLVGRFSALDDRSKTMAAAVGGIAAAAGPTLLLFGHLVSAAAKLGPLLAALTGPAGLAVAAIVGIGAAWKLNLFGIRDLTTHVAERVGAAFERISRFFQAAQKRGLDPFEAGMRALIVWAGENLGVGNPLEEFLQGLYRNAQKARNYIENILIPTIKNIGTTLTGGDFEGAADLMARLVDDLRAGFGRTIGAFLTDVDKRLTDGFRSINWVQAGTYLRNGLGIVFAQTGDLSKEPNWQKMWDDLWENTQAEISNLQKVATWAENDISDGDWEATTNSLIVRGKALGNALITNTQQELSVLANMGDWALDRILGVDWSESVQAMMDAAGELIGGFLQGLGDAWARVQSWISGGADSRGGEQSGLGERFWQMIVGAMASVKERITDAGADALQYFFDGLQAKWAEIEEWTSGLELPVVPMVPVQPGMEGAPQAQPRQNTDRAYGGPGGRWVTVGEFGPELVKLPTGAMVIPHGAAQTRLEAMGGMAMGGVVLTPALASGLERAWQGIGAYGGNRTPPILAKIARRLRASLMRGRVNLDNMREWILALKGFGGDRTAPEIVAQAQALERLFFGGRNVTPTGTLNRAEDRSIVSFTNPSRDPSEREMRERERRLSEFRTTAPTSRGSATETDRLRRMRRRRNRSRRVEEFRTPAADDAGVPPGFRSWEDFQDYMSDVHGQNVAALARASAPNFYAPVHITAATPDIHREISSYMATRQRS